MKRSILRLDCCTYILITDQKRHFAKQESRHEQCVLQLKRVPVRRQTGSQRFLSRVQIFVRRQSDFVKEFYA